MRKRSIITWRIAALAVCLLAVAGCSEGPPTQAELDAIASMQRVHGQVSADAQGHATSLVLVGEDVHDLDLAPVAQLHDLKFLSLERTPIGDAGLAHLARLTDLQSLSLAGTKVTDAGISQLAGLSSLENLDLEGTAITDKGLLQLAPITSLRKVYVSRKGPSQAAIDDLESANPRLHVTRQ